MRPIDADALMLTFNDWWYSSFGQEETEQSLTIKEAMKAIETAPTVDTKRQGRWVRFYGDHIHMGLRPEWDCCSECGMVGTPTRYCSNCGARMDDEI